MVSDTTWTLVKLWRKLWAAMKARIRIWLLFLAPPKYAQDWIAELGAWCSSSCWGKGLGSPDTSRCPLIKLCLIWCQGSLPWRQSRSQAPRWCQHGHWRSYLPQELLSVHAVLRKSPHLVSLFLLSSWSCWDGVWRPQQGGNSSSCGEGPVMLRHCQLGSSKSSKTGLLHQGWTSSEDAGGPWLFKKACYRLSTVFSILSTTF